MNFTKTFLKSTIALVFFMVMASVANAAPVINYGSKSLCKNIADSAKNNDYFDNNANVTAYPGDTVTIAGYAANSGTSVGNVNFSVQYQNNTPTTNHTFVVTVNGVQRTVYATTTTPVVLQLSAVDQMTRVDLGSTFSNTQLPGLPTSTNLNISAAGGNFVFNQAYLQNCNGGYGQFQYAGVPATYAFEKGVIWYYDVPAAPAATASISPANQSVNAGTSATYTITTANANSCNLSISPSLSYSPLFINPNGTTNVTVFTNGANPGSYQLFLSCDNGQATDQANLTVNQVVVAPTVMMTPGTATVAAGANVSFTVTPTNATSCTLTDVNSLPNWNPGFISGANPSTFTVSTTGATPGSVYAIGVQCTGPGGNTGMIYSYISITQAQNNTPTLSLRANGNVAPSQNSAYNLVSPNTLTLSWSMTNLTSCNLYDPSNNLIDSNTYGAGVLTDSFQIAYNQVVSGQYTLNCSGPGGSLSDVAWISVAGGGLVFPVVLTTGANPSATTAYVTGDLSNDGAGYADLYFIYSTDQNDVNNVADCNLVTTQAQYELSDQNITTNALYPFDATLTGLSANTTYYFASCVRDTLGQYDIGAVMYFTTDAANGGNGLSIDTLSEQNVTDDSAELNAELINDGSGNTDLWFIISDTQSEVDSASDCNSFAAQHITHINNYNGNGYSFSENATGLNDNTDYYFAACAQDSSGVTVNGGVQSFQTDDANGNGSWEVITDYATNVDGDSAVLNGQVDGQDNVDTWFVYSETDSAPECGTGTSGTTNDEFESVSGLFDDGDDFDSTASGLDDNTTYYYRACGEYAGDVEEGNVRSFTTGIGINPGPGNNQSAPIVTTLIPSSIGGTSAGFASTYNSGGCPITMWFEYTTVPGSFSQRTADVNKGNTYGGHSTNVNGLISGVTYYVRAVGRNCLSTTYGNIVSFRTVGTINGGGGGVVQPIYVGGGGNGTEWLKLDIDDNTTTIFTGQTLQYVVKYENLTKSLLEDTEISVVFPKELRVVSTTRGQILGNDNSVIFDIGELKGLEKDEFTVTVRVRSIAAGTTVVGQAVAGFDTPRIKGDDTRARLTATDFDADTVGAGGGIGAAAFGAGPFGLGFIGWLLLILILVLIYLVARYAAMARNRQYPYYYQNPPHPYQLPPQQMYAPAPQPVYVQQPPVYQAPAPAPAPQPVIMRQAEPELPTEPEYEYQPYRPVPPGDK